MRAMQMTIGAVIVVAGILLLLATNSWLALTLLDVAGIALILSGLLFWIPGLAWRREVPWLTSLFIPGTIAFAAGAILIYAGRTHLSEMAYLWTAIVLAVGIAFLAMYYWGPRQRWLWFVGALISAIGALLLAVSLSLFASLAAARVVGAALLIALGLIFAVRAFIPHKSSAPLANTRQ